MSFNNRFKIRPLSYSQLSTWEYNKDQWWKNYVLEEKDPPNPAMQFGTLVGDSIGTLDSLVPELIPPGVKEYPLEAQLGEIRIIGYADHFCPKSLVLHENKTSDNHNRWDQKKVDEHKQLDMYSLMLFLRDKIKPEDIQMQLNFIPVIRGGDMLYKLPDPPTYIPFQTKRTTINILRYSSYILETVKEMEVYYNKRINTNENYGEEPTE